MAYLGDDGAGRSDPPEQGGSGGGDVLEQRRVGSFDGCQMRFAS